MQEIERLARKESAHLYVTDKENDKIVISGTWDDLSPEPGRTEVIESLHSIRRHLVGNDNYFVDDIQGQYGRAKLVVTEKS